MNHNSNDKPGSGGPILPGNVANAATDAATLQTLTYDRVVSADADTVFSYLSQEQLLTKWLAHRATVNLRPGGDFTLTWSSRRIVAGTFEIIQPPNLLKLLWTDTLARKTVVTLSLKSRHNRTYLHLEHDLNEYASTWEWADRQKKSWIFFLDNLCSVIESSADLRQAKAIDKGWEWLQPDQ